MKTILFLSKSQPNAGTGAESVIWDVGRFLAEEGWDVHFLCPTVDKEPPLDNIHFHHFISPSHSTIEKCLFFISSIPKYYKIVNSIEPDIIYDNASPIPFPPAHLSHSDKTIVKVHHSLWGLRALKDKGEIPTKLFTPVGEQFFRLIDGKRILTVSWSSKERLSSIVIRNSEDITVVPNWVDTSQFQPSFNPEGPVLSLTAMKPWKGVDTLIEAWSQLPKSLTERGLIIAGDGPMRDEWQSMAESLNARNIQFTGYVSHEKKLELFENSFCYVLPTKHEGWGLSNLEAMASACLVISTSADGVRDYLQHGENGLMIPPDNPNELRKLLAQVLTNPASYQEVANKGVLTANRFDINKGLELERETLGRYLSEEH